MIAHGAVSLRRRRADRDLAQIRRRMAEIEAEAKATSHLSMPTTGELFDELARTRRPKLRVLNGEKT